MGPLYKFGWFDFNYGLELAGLIGFFFGFLLERAGFGNPRKLTAIFYLRDFAVLKVMFTAIVVCMLGLLYFSVLGWIDLGRVYLLPTYIWPQIAGGFVLGVGFVMGGYCPTTSVVAAVSGKLDALIFIIGMMAGSLVFAEMFPVLERFHTAGSMGPVRLPEVLGISSGWVALLVCVMALSAYWFVEKVERRFGNAETLPTGSRPARRWAAALLPALGLILAVVNPDRVLEKKPAARIEIRQPPRRTVDDRRMPEKTPSPTFEIVEDEGC